MGAKYRLMWPKAVKLPTGEVKWLHRIKATRDIPEYSIRKGQLGGWVSGKNILSHEGSCWIEENAIVEKNTSGMSYGPIQARQDKNRYLITGSAIITGRAYVLSSYIHDAEIRDYAFVQSSVIRGEHEIYDEARVMRTNMSGSGIQISGETTVEDCRLDGKIRVAHYANLFNVSANAIGFIGFSNQANVTGATFATDDTSTILVHQNAVIKKTTALKSSFFAHDGSTMEIGGETVIASTMVMGGLITKGNIAITDSDIAGKTILTGADIEVRAGTRLRGNTVIGKDGVIFEGKYLNGLPAGSDDGTQEKIQQKNIPSPSDNIRKMVKAMATPYAPKNPEPVPSEAQRHLDVINEVMGEYDAYTTDLVNLIKYPAMADASVLETQHLLVAIKRAKRATNYPEELEALKTASEALEQAFVTAENRAKALAAEYLDDKKKGSLRKANQLITMACDDASTEHEKQASVKATLSTLAGIFEISDKAVENLKARVGILEIEA